MIRKSLTVDITRILSILYGTAKLEGDASILKKLASTMVEFDPRFEFMPGTRASDTEVAKANPYKAVPRQTIAE